MKDAFIIRGRAAIWLVVVTFLSIVVGARLEGAGAVEGFGLTVVMVGPVVLFVLVNRLWFFYRSSRSSSKN
ncbi:hypothetical protein ACYZUD_07955 [Pseudomonas sp. XS1P51]